MFVGVARFVTEIGDDNGGQEARNGDRTNDWDDSEFLILEKYVESLESGPTARSPFEIPTIVAEDSGTKFVGATTITVINHPIDHYAGYSVTRDFVGTADASCTNGIEEWLLDSGATSGVTDNSHMTDMRPSNRKIEIGNGDMIETFGQGTSQSSSKSTLTKAKVPGKTLLDISGPYADSLNQNKYWLRIVDDFSKFSWDCFLPKKSGIQIPLAKLLKANKAAGKPCKRCDNAGENESYVQELCVEYDVILEMTAPNTPQMNGVVERSFVTCRNRAFATMYCAKLSLETQALLWPEAINTVTKLGNSLPKKASDDPYTLWYGAELKAKLDPKSFKCIFVGYSDDHSGDTYKFYNPATKQTILSRDVHQWMEWHGRISATDDLPLFEQLKILEDSSVIVPASAIVPYVEDAEVRDVDDLLDIPAATPGPVAEDVIPNAPAIVDVPARRNLAASFSPAHTRSKTASSYAGHGRCCDVCSMRDDTKCDVAIGSTVGSTKELQELIKQNDPLWIKSMHSELENFLKRNAWEFLRRSMLPKGRKTLRTRWIFKEKTDGTKKSRSVILGSSRYLA
ncbi:PIF1-like helicase [Fragilaria crotonensis]|nr:PIF1-like helicase [Fragilaria crotonensis]